MKKNIIIILFTFLFISCLKGKKNIESNDNLKQVDIDYTIIYNNILNLLIENHLYDRYLGREGELLTIELYKKKIDSVSFVKRFNELKRKVINNDSLKGTLYVNDEVITDNKIDKESLNFIQDYIKAVNMDSILQNLKVNKQLNASNLSSNLVKIKNQSEMNDENDNSSFFEVGNLTFSKIYVSKENNYYVLYFGFVCGSKCGEGGIILVENKKGNWTLIKKKTLWEI